MDLTALKQSVILIVDDEEANVRTLGRFLEREGYTGVVGLTHGRDLLAKLGELRPDLLVIDLHMPFPDGFVLLDWLGGAVPRDEYLPILVVTGDTTIETRNRALALGARDFLTKPYDWFEVRYRIRNLLHTRALWRDLQSARERLGELPPPPE